LPSTVEKLQRARKDQKFTILLIDIQENSIRVATWVKSQAITSTVLLDTDGSVTRAYQVAVTPTVVIIGRDGKLVARATGPRPWDGRPAQRFLDLLVAAPEG